MKRQYIDTELLENGEALLEGEEARHLATVLRVTPGEAVEAFDGRGRIRRYRIAQVAKRRVVLAAAGDVTTVPPPSCAVTLFVCVSKGNRMDWCIEKAAELGASRVVPVLSERTIVRLGDEEAAARCERWSRLAREATRQCGAAWTPQIAVPCTVAQTIPLVAAAAPVFLASLQENAAPLQAALAKVEAKPSQAGWYVGPEGDFTSAEEASLCAAGAIPVSLGKLVLRAETAALYGLCVLNSRWEGNSIRRWRD